MTILCRFRPIAATLLYISAGVLALASGCGDGSKKSKPVAPKPTNSNPAPVTEQQPQKFKVPGPSPTSPPPKKKTMQEEAPPERRTLGNLLEQGKKEAGLGSGEAIANGAPVTPPKPRIDEAKGAGLGIRKVVGKHLTLFTDMPAALDVDELITVFDQAVPQWCEYFAIDPARLEKWHLFAYLMKEKEKFIACGALTPDLPDFPHGYQHGWEFWVYEQPTVFYRRHLMLHEGTHGFMAHHLGNYGPPWYAEGSAELLATHRWHEGQLQLRYVPRDRNEAPGWGRVKVIRDDFAAKKAKRLEEVMQYGPRDHYRVEPYAWCWAAASFLDNHSRSREKFRALRKEVNDFSIEFSLRFQKALADDWRVLSEDWELFVSQLDYGMDVSRMEVLRTTAVKDLPAEGATVTIAADRGWQSSGWRLEAGKKYLITASGRYQVANQPRPWPCEAGGVTIHYYQHLPLGMLVGAICNDDGPLTGITPLAQPDPIGVQREFECQRTGTAYFRINEFCGHLSDNAGTLTVRIVPK